MEKMAKPGDSGAERWKNPEIRRATFFISEAIDDIYEYNQEEISSEGDSLKLTGIYSDSLSNLGLSLSSFYEYDKSATYRPIRLVLKDFKKFMDYLSYIENTDEPSFLTDLDYILPDTMIWFSNQMVKANKENSAPEKMAVDFLLDMDTILKKLEIMDKKLGSENSDQYIKLNIRKFKTLIKFRNEESLNEFFNVLPDPVDFNEIEVFNENPESFFRYLVEEYQDSESFNDFLIEKVSLLDSILEKENLTPQYEKVFSYIYYFLNKLSSEPSLDGRSISKLKEELEDRREEFEEIIQGRK